MIRVYCFWDLLLQERDLDLKKRSKRRHILIHIHHAAVLLKTLSSAYEDGHRLPGGWLRSPGSSI